MQAELALQTDETPVGCVLVHDGRIIVRGMNATNRSLNGTRHAEFIAVNELLSPCFSSFLTSHSPQVEGEERKEANGRGNEGTKPSYLEKLSLLRKSDLYVTVEPCIMCASFLRQLGIRKVYFGAVNDRFGGTGGVLNIHDMEYPSLDNERNRGYEVSGGWLREEAIMLLRRFYVQENEKGEFVFCLPRLLPPLASLSPP